MAHSPHVNFLTDTVKTMTEVQAKATLIAMIRQFGTLSSPELRDDLLIMTGVTMALVIRQTKEI